MYFCSGAKKSKPNKRSDCVSQRIALQLYELLFISATQQVIILHTYPGEGLVVPRAG